MDSKSAPKQFIHHLELEIQLIQELNKLLASEKEALSSRTFNELEALSLKKQELSEQLEESGKLKMTLLEDASTLKANEYLQKILLGASAKEQETIGKLNKVFSELLTICRDSNTVNGQVIATNIYTHQEIVDLLTGNKKKDPASVYTASGEIKGPGGEKRSTHHKEA
jgi:flagella synthesis protein FlgN